MLPAASVACTENVYDPSGWPVREYALGLAHDPHADTIVPPRSSWHSNVAPPSPLNDHDGLPPEPGVAGAEVIDGAAGALVSSA